MIRSEHRPFQITPALCTITITTAAIATIAPFDRIFNAIAQGSMPVQAALASALALAGAWCANQLGHELTPQGRGAPWLSGIAAAAAIALYVIVLDCWLFRDLLAPDYVRFLHQPLAFRLQYFMIRAFNENVFYRLFLFSVLAWLIQSALKRRIPGGWLFAAMVAAQMVNIGINVTARGPISAPILGYDLLRYIVPGVLWAMLFVRNGFATAEVASVGCHLFLQPGFTLFLGNHT